MEARAGRVYEFGPFRLEPAERRLLREGTPIVLTAKVLDLLIAGGTRRTSGQQRGITQSRVA